MVNTRLVNAPPPNLTHFLLLSEFNMYILILIVDYSILTIIVFLSPS